MNILRYIAAGAGMLVLFCTGLQAQTKKTEDQFKDEPFSQTYVDENDTTGRDSTDAVFTLKSYMRGLTHKEPQNIGTMFAGSTVLIGGQQIYNRDYWKLPVIYGGMAATAAVGISKLRSDDDSAKKTGRMMLAGTALIYWASLMDGAVCYRGDDPHNAGRATIYSILLPGMGQVYNGELWKVPIYYTGMAFSIHFLITNNKNYHRYKWIHNEATREREEGEESYDGPVTESTALYYRDVFRRYRDYSIVALAAVYLLQVIDANVFSYMRDFQLTDDVSLSVKPAVVSTGSDTALAFNPSSSYGIGMRVGLRF